MRISDWSSDVCSSDLADAVVQRLAVLLEDRFRRSDLIARLFGASFAVLLPGAGHRNARLLAENLRAAVERSEERRVGKEVSVRVDLGGRRIIKKKNNHHTHNHNQAPQPNTYKR